MNRWDYIPDKEISNGYEDVFDKLKSYTHEDFMCANELQKEQIIEDVFNIYRSRNIFPIQYYNEEGIKKEIQKCIDKEVGFKDGTLDLKFNQGSSLCRFMFPNVFKVICKGAKNNSLFDRFYDDHKLKKSISFALNFRHNCTPSEIKSSQEMIGGNVAVVFKPMVAKALYQKYVPKNGIVLDSCSGFGGRMLGLLSTDKNATYIGTEVCSETVECLNELGEYIEKVTGRKDSYKILKLGSEDFNLKKEVFDFSFTSPPYFNLENYSDEETQSIVKFPTLDRWLEGYVKPTIQNNYDMLKTGCYYAVNIADFNLGKQRVEFVNNWIEYCKDIGFKHVDTISMKLQSRRGNGNDPSNLRTKQEGIYVFKK